MGHTSRQPACVQCLHTSEDISQRNSGVSGGVVSAGLSPGTPEETGGPSVAASCRSPPAGPGPAVLPAPAGFTRADGGPTPGIPRSTSARPLLRACLIRSASCSTNATCRQVFAPSPPVLS